MSGAVTVQIQRSSTMQPWGFRLQGGQDFRQELSIKKVNFRESRRQRVGQWDLGSLQIHDLVRGSHRFQGDRMKLENILIVKRKQFANRGAKQWEEGVTCFLWSQGPGLQRALWVRQPKISLSPEPKLDTREGPFTPCMHGSLCFGLIQEALHWKTNKPRTSVKDAIPLSQCYLASQTHEKNARGF